MFENTYLVTDKLETYSHADVDAAEAALGTRFPDGYREYVTTLGKGDYCNFVWMYAPASVVQDRAGRRADFEKYAHHWEDGFDVLSPERLPECIVVGASIDADLIAFHPDTPNALYELPRHDSTIFRIGTTLGEALGWYCQERLKIKLGYFDSHNNQRSEPLPATLNLSLDDFRDWAAATGEYDFLEEKWNDNPGVTLDMVAALKLNMETVAPELGEVMAFYKSFGGYVWVTVDGAGDVNAQLVHDAKKDTVLMQKILAYLRSKAA